MIVPILDVIKEAIMESNPKELETQPNPHTNSIPIVNNIDVEDFLKWCEHKKQTGSKPVDDYKAYPDT